MLRLTRDTSTPFTNRVVTGVILDSCDDFWDYVSEMTPKALNSGRSTLFIAGEGGGGGSIAAVHLTFICLSVTGRDKNNAERYAPDVCKCTEVFEPGPKNACGSRFTK